LIGRSSIRLRRLFTEKTWRCWKRLDDTSEFLSPSKVDKLAKDPVKVNFTSFESSGQQEPRNQSAPQANVQKLTCLSDRVYEATLTATQSLDTYMHLVNVTNSTTFLDES
jgi:hypothetical protein